MELPDDPATQAAGIVAAGGILWKLYRWFKEDGRTEESKATQQDAYETLIKQQRDEIERLSKRLEAKDERILQLEARLEAVKQ